VRRLTYRDDWPMDGADVRRYDMLANAVIARLAVRPFGALPGFEILMSGELVTTVPASQGPGNQAYATRSSQLLGGGRYAFDAGLLRAAVEAGVGLHRFAISDEMSSFGELVPDTEYRFARLGAGATFPLGAATANTSLGYRRLFGTGELTAEQWFPRATGGGVDAMFGCELALTRYVRAHVQTEVRRYFFAMNPEPGDALIVGGALDEYLIVTAGLSLAVL
jgi:hypothetical protein